jgi:hypothetical protein
MPGDTPVAGLLTKDAIDLPAKCSAHCLAIDRTPDLFHHDAHERTKRCFPPFFDKIFPFLNNPVN